MSEPHNPRLIEPDYLESLAVMGHRLQTRLQRDPRRCESVVDLRHTAPGMDHWQQVTMRVSDVGLDAVLGAAVEEALRTLLSQKLREQIGHVSYALRKGPLPCELVGGPRDGEVIDGLRSERDGWPMRIVRMPVPTFHRASFTDWDAMPGFDSIPDIATYEREWVNPDTLHWRYLAAKGS